MPPDPPSKVHATCREPPKQQWPVGCCLRPRAPGPVRFEPSGSSYLKNGLLGYLVYMVALS